MRLAPGTRVGDRLRQSGRGQAGAELQGPLFALDDDFVVLALLVDRAGRGARCRADRAPDDCPDGPADDCADDCAGDATADRAAGLLVTVARGTRHVVFPERFASLDAVVRDGFGLDNSVSHGWISCRGFAPVSAAGECAVRAPPRHEGPSSRRAPPGNVTALPALAPRRARRGRVAARPVGIRRRQLPGSPRICACHAVSWRYRAGAPTGGSSARLRVAGHRMNGSGSVSYP